MTQNIALAVGEIWTLCILVFILHRIRPRYGLTLLLSLTVGLSVLLQTPIIAVDFIALSDQFLIILGTTVLIPVILISVLILYVLDGTFVARQMIYGILGVTVVSIVISRLFLLNVRLPGGGNWFGLPVDAPIYSFDLRSTAASLLAFTADLYVIVLVYQAITNYFRRVPRWVGAGIGLLSALIVDTILYAVVAYGGNPGFLADIEDELLTKLAAGVAAWPLLAIYLGWLAPRFTDVEAREPRPTFDLLFGSISRMEADLREAERASQRSQADVQHLRSYIGDASHDLRHPLSVIKIRLPMLLMSTNEVQQKKNYYIIRQETDRLENMIDDLLVLSRLDELDELTTEPTDLNRVAQAAADEVRSLVAARGQSLEVRLAESLPLVPLNASDVRRAITNLIENAIRYTPDGGSIEIETRADRADVVLQVSDTGCGIAESDLPHIFERFYRSQESAKANASGTGLGLAIVKKVVDKHNGRIEASSVVDKGTTFVVRFPTSGG